MFANIFTVLNTVVKMDTNERIPTARTSQSGNGTTKRHINRPAMHSIKTAMLIARNFFIYNYSFLFSICTTDSCLLAR